MYQSLYRKYRPKKFSEVCGQDVAKKILMNAILKKTVSHAYLFFGPRGTGKTSIAKMFARIVNCEHQVNGECCEKCNNCIESNQKNCVDIIEIDAASNNGVDEIRELKNKINLVPSKLKYKVYIIDEVHMLTNSAFNALLKTLEEPPSHVVFILATTEFYEVPETIISRCQCFSFSRITQKSLEKRLKYIADTEKIKIEDDAIAEIAQYSNGGLRDAIGMLDKLNSFTNECITVDIFKSINGMISSSEIESFYNDLLDGNLQNILLLINKVNDQGYDFKNFIERVMLLTRDKVIDYYTNNSDIKNNVEDNVELITTLNEILNRLKDAVNPVVIVQIYLLKYLKDTKSVRNEQKNEVNAEIISREIKTVMDKSSEIVKKEKNELKKEEKNTNKILINEENKNIRINNAMATANLNYKKELTTIWKSLEKYFMDDKYGKVAQLLSDTEVMVVGSNYSILSSVSEGLITNIYTNLDIVEDFFNKIYRKMSIVIVKNDEFERIKNKYIEDRKNNIIYQEKKEYGKLVEESDNLISQAINVFGSDIVEIE